MTKSIVVVGALCALVGLGAALIPRARVKMADTAQLKRELSSLREDLDAVTREGRKPMVVIQAAASAEPVADHAEEPAPSEEPAITARTLLQGVDEEQRHYRIGVVRDARERLVADVLDREPIDAAWSKAATTQLQAAYQGEEFAGASFVADCRSTMCKIRITSQHPGDGERAMRRMIEKSPWPTNGISRFSRETGEGFIYFAREGTRLPEVDLATVSF